MPWEAVAFATANLLLAGVAWWRAGRAVRLAERAELRANAAESRAEEAHALLKERSATAKERHKAELDAPAIADRWRGQLSIAAQEAQRRGKNHFGHATFSLTNLAEHLALQMLRAERDTLGIVEIIQREGAASVAVLTPYQLNQQRARERR